MTAIVLPIVLPLAAAAVSAMIGNFPRMRRVLGVGTLLATTVAAVNLLTMVSDGSIVVGHLGGWPWPLGITLVADPLAAIMIVVSSLMLLVVLLYAIGSPRTVDASGFFHPVYLILATGVSLSFLTGDLFNLFVAFEVTLTASYVLITYGGDRLQVRHGVTYIVISLSASILFLTAIGLMYASTGTVNMADLSGKLGEVTPALRSGLGILFLVVFGIKAAIFPLFFWLPDSYPVAPSPVTAIFAGLLTKIGVYAIIRSHTLLFSHEQPSRLLLVVAALTMVVGVLGAAAQDDVKRVLSFHIISQIGYMIFGLALFTFAGLAAAVFFIVHQIIVKTVLLLVAGLIEQRAGTGALRQLSGLMHTAPIIAVLFMLSALSLAGVPPFSGFVAKLSLIQAGLEAGAYVTVAVSLFVSVLTLFSMTKIWAGAFWGDPMESDTPEMRRLPPLMVSSTAFLVVVSLAFVFAAAPIWELSEVAAEGLVNPAVYVTAVRGG